MEISPQTPLLKNQISLEGEAIMSMAVAQLLWVKGQWPMCISNGDSEHLATVGIAVWLRHDPETMRSRLKVLESKVA